MAGLIEIRSELFTPIQRLDHFEIYRDGFCLLIKNNRTREGYMIKYVDLGQMLMELMPAKVVSIPVKMIEAVLTLTYEEHSNLLIPTDEEIIQYCIDKGWIAHPFEEYNSIGVTA